MQDADLASHEVVLVRARLQLAREAACHRHSLQLLDDVISQLPVAQVG